MPSLAFSQYNNLLGIEYGNYHLNLNNVEKYLTDAEVKYYYQIGALFEHKKNKKKPWSLLLGVHYNEQVIGYQNLSNGLTWFKNNFGSISVGVNYNYYYNNKHQLYIQIKGVPNYYFNAYNKMDVFIKIASGYGYMKGFSKNRKLIVRVQPALNFTPVKQYFQGIGYFFNNNYSFGLELVVLFGK